MTARERERTSFASTPLVVEGVVLDLYANFSADDQVKSCSPSMISQDVPLLSESSNFLSEPYEYEPLPTPRSIRLVQVHGQNEDGLLQCSISVVDLNDRPFYNCLSYTWGNPFSDRSNSPTEDFAYDNNTKWPISCDGKLLYISQNLYDALRQLPRWQIAEVEDIDGKFWRTPLHDAALEGDVDRVSHLLSKKANVASLDYYGKSPVHYAVANKHHAVMKLLAGALSQPRTPRSSDLIAVAQHRLPEASAQVQQGDNLLWNDIDNCLQCLKLQDGSSDTGCRQRPGFKQDLIWIDAICINQEDKDERSAQVRFMGEIYESAQTVFAWLGPEDKYTKDAARVVESLAFDNHESKQQFFRTYDPAGSDQRAAYSLLGISGFSDGQWEAASAFLQRSWFSRAWIIQEVVLAKRIVVICGSYYGWWNCISSSSHYLVLSEWGIRLGKLAGRPSVGEMPMALYRTRQFRRDPEYSDEFLKLIRHVIFCRGCNAADPRDKIYSLLGFTVALPQPFKTSEIIIPDYKKSVPEIYIEASKVILLSSEDLRLFSLVAEELQGRRQDLPSWVPDFSVRGSRPAGLFALGVMVAGRDGKSFYNAAAGLPRQLRYPLDNTTVCIHGHHFDRINGIGESISEIGQSSRSFLGLLNLVLSLEPIYCTGEGRSDVFWRTMIADQCGDQHPAPASLKVPFMKHIYGMLVDVTRPFSAPEASEDQTKALFKAHSDGILHLGLQLSQRDLNDAIREMTSHTTVTGDFGAGHEYIVPWRNAYGWRRLFRTHSGYLGIGPQSLQIGDVVSIVPGSIVPFLLRKVQDNRYRLVGEAYVHGIMHGEALKSKELGLEEIVLE